MERKAYWQYLVMAGAALLVAGGLTPVHAQDPDDLKRGVARISLMDGDVSVRRGDAGEWVAGVINAPLMAEDHIATGANSRAEVQFDASNILRIGGNAEIRLAQLESGRTVVEIVRGTLTYRILRAPAGSVELNTPSISVRPAKEGAVRISVNGAGESEITPRIGDVEIFSPKGTQWVYGGQSMLARGSASDPEFQMNNAIPVDDWDRWNDSRDRMLLQSTSSRYLPPGVYGAEELDTTGTWTYVEPYGYCWHPTVVAAGWSPYRFGRWAWVDWYGWTWVSYDPWGWAPYHYGRWFWSAGFGWGWYPGVVGVRHYWSPALVAFFGFGHGGGVGFGFGNVGWVPLAPYETFRPWWGRYGGGGVNFTTVNVVNVYRNARVTNGIAAVSAEDFRGGRFNNVARVNSQQVQQAGAIRGAMGITPTAASRQFSDRPAASIPRNSVVAPSGRTLGSQQSPSSFRRFGEPAGSGSTQNARPAQPTAGSQTPGGNRNSGLQHFGEPGSSQGTVRNDRPSSAQTGWRSFGTPAPAGSQPRSNPSPSYNTPQRPQYSAPSRGVSPSPSYSAPSRSAPSYSAPRSSAPGMSAPSRGAAPSGGGARSSGGGGGKRR